METESRSNEQQAPAKDAAAMKDEARGELTALLQSGRIHASEVKSLTYLLATDDDGVDVEMESANPTGARSSSSSNSKDAIVGLEFTSGRIMYCHRSTLVNAGGYFSACFGGNGIPAVPVSVDERGRNIYFIERDGELFADCILPFILRRTRDELPAFSDDPKLWRRLRSETLFFVMDDLSELLHVTHSCPYVKGNDRGVLYWLGTGKGKHEYRNPYSIRAVNVTVGGLEDVTFEQRSELFDSLEDVDIDPRAYTSSSKEAMVQYRPPIIGCEEENLFYYGALYPCYSFWHQLSLHRVPSVIDLLTAKLRLTAYSLRSDKHGMTDWNLEASEDGESWTVLHEARNDRHLADLDESLKQKWEGDLQEGMSTDEQVDVTMEFAEREMRHTWEVAPAVSNVFYRYFRIIGWGSDYERHDDSSPCLHGLGLELYGDVHED